MRRAQGVWGLVLAVAAAALAPGAAAARPAGWRAFYADALPARAGEYRTADNAYRLLAVTRWDGQGRPHVENGWGQAAAGGSRARLAPAVAAWLDQAEIALGSDEPFDLLQAMLLTGNTTPPLFGQASEAGPTGSCQELAGRTLRLATTGSLLPDRVDLLLRVRARPRSDPEWEVAVRPGAEVRLPTGVLRVRELRKGTGPFMVGRRDPQTSEVTIVEVPPSENPAPEGTTVTFDYEPIGGGGGQYVVTPLGRDGRPLLEPVANEGGTLYPPTKPGKAATSWTHPDLPVARLLIYPERPTMAFYFPGVRLPAVRTALAQPPVVTLALGKASTASSRLGPIRVTADLQAGRREMIFSAGEKWVYLEPYGAAEPKPGSTLTFRIEGLLPDAAGVTLLDGRGQPIPAPEVGLGAWWGRTCGLAGLYSGPLPPTELSALRLDLRVGPGEGQPVAAGAGMGGG